MLKLTTLEIEHNLTITVKNAQTPLVLYLNMHHAEFLKMFTSSTIEHNFVNVCM